VLTALELMENRATYDMSSASVHRDFINSPVRPSMYNTLLAHAATWVCNISHSLNYAIAMIGSLISYMLGQHGIVHKRVQTNDRSVYRNY